MGRAKPKSSPTDQYARKLAQAIAKGRLPPFSDAFDRFCDSSQDEIFAAFAGAARHMPLAGKDHALAVGYLFVLQRLLEHLRYRTDHDYDDAAKLIADFQAHVVAQVEAGNVAGGMLAFVGAALHQSKIPASPEFAAASNQCAVEQTDVAPVPADVHAALAGVVGACEGDPFLAIGALTEGSHACPLTLAVRWPALWQLKAAPGDPASHSFSCSIRIPPCNAQSPARSSGWQRR